jgi:hypothetical protein
MRKMSAYYVVERCDEDHFVAIWAAKVSGNSDVILNDVYHVLIPSHDNFHEYMYFVILRSNCNKKRAGSKEYKITNLRSLRYI